MNRKRFSVSDRKFPLLPLLVVGALLCPVVFAAAYPASAEIAPDPGSVFPEPVPEVHLETYTAAVPCTVERLEDPALPAGTERILSEGSDGQTRRIARVTCLAGRETSRVILQETPLVLPMPRVMVIGTGASPTSGSPIIEDGMIRLPTGEVLTYTGTARVRATAYTHTDPGCTMITYTGTTVHVGTVAVDPRFIPYGTRMFIIAEDGSYVYGVAEAEDCGGDIKGDRVDLYLPTYDACIAFGRRTCTVYFLG